MRVNVISALGETTVAAQLADLGCAARELAAGASGDDMVSGADLVIVVAGQDGELGRFLVARARSTGVRVPVLMVIDDKQLARLDPSWGHDDFLVSPYTPSELYARVRAAEWSASEFTQPERIKVGPLVIDPAAREAVVDGARIDLTRREFELLLTLARSRGTVMTRAKLLSQVFGLARGSESRTLDVHVRMLRSKVGSSVVIETVRGVGYKVL